MSVRYEGASARGTSVSIVPAGKELGEDIIPEGQMALVFSYDEVFYIQGTAEQLRKLLQRALDKINDEADKEES